MAQRIFVPGAPTLTRLCISSVHMQQARSPGTCPRGGTSMLPCPEADCGEVGENPAVTAPPPMCGRTDPGCCGLRPRTTLLTSFSPISAASQIPRTLCADCKRSQKGGIRNCSLLSILRDGETLQECCSRDWENTICGKAFRSEESSICPLVGLLEHSELGKRAPERV